MTFYGILEIDQSFQIGISTKNEIQKCQRKRKGNTFSPTQEERKLKLRIKSKNYQTNKEEKEKYKKEEHKKTRKKRGGPPLNIIYIFDE